MEWLAGVRAVCYYRRMNRNEIIQKTDDMLKERFGAESSEQEPEADMFTVELAQQRHECMEQFLQEFLDEWEASARRRLAS